MGPAQDSDIYVNYHSYLFRAINIYKFKIKLIAFFLTEAQRLTCYTVSIMTVNSVFPIC
jgi:hypothetical protein